MRINYFVGCIQICINIRRLFAVVFRELRVSKKKKKDRDLCKTIQSLLRFDLFPLTVNRPSGSFISRHPVQVSESRKR